MAENTFYRKRNKKFLGSINDWITGKLLQKGEYGTGSLTIKIQDGIIQDVTTERLKKLALDGEPDGKETE